MQVTDLIRVAGRFTLFDFRTEADVPLLPYIIGEAESAKRDGLIDVDQIVRSKTWHWKLSRLSVLEFIVTSRGVLVVVVEGSLDEIKELLSD